MNALHPLGQLIQSVEDSRGWTLREIARRIERAGESISHAYIGRLKKQPIRSVSFETIQLLAIGLDVPERVVGDAALKAMGVHDIDSAGAGVNVAIAQDPELSERDRRILLAVVREMQGEHEEQPASASTRNGDPVEDSPQPDGVTPLTGERRRRRTSERRPRLLSDDVDEDILELPYAADDSEDPGEDDG